MVDTGESVYDWINRNTSQNGASRVVTVAGGTVIINAQRAAEVGDAEQVSSMPGAPNAPAPAFPVAPDDPPEELS